jgi:hypothetical protein
VGKLVRWSRRQRRRACTAGWWPIARSCRGTRGPVGGQLSNDRRAPRLDLLALKDQPADAPVIRTSSVFAARAARRRVVRTSTPIRSTRSPMVYLDTTLLPTVPCIIAGNTHRWVCSQGRLPIRRRRGVLAAGLIRLGAFCRQLASGDSLHCGHSPRSPATIGREPKASLPRTTRQTRKESSTARSYISSRREGRETRIECAGASGAPSGPPGYSEGSDPVHSDK